MKRAVFLDRDGTINVDHGYVHEIDRFELIPGVLEFCRSVQDLGYLLIVVTNQSGIARGFYTEADYQRLTDWMRTCFSNAGVQITDCFHCPVLTGPDRKPNPGMFLKARDKYDIDMGMSVSVGDRQRDVDAGIAAGVGTNLLYEGDYGQVLAAIRGLAR